MAQSIVLKRSALSGKVPGTGSLSLGEIAINTFDGRLFFKKSGSAESVEHIVTTNSTTTGSITLTRTGSFGEIVVTQDGNFQRDIFVTRDIVANGDIDILGSLTASLSNGYIWVGNGSNKTILSSTSSFITNLSPLNSYTASIDTKFATLATTTASLLVETSNLELFSASALTRLTNIELFSSSENSKNTTLATYTGSNDTKWTTLQNVTSSILSFTSSANSRFSNLESFTASIDNTFVNNTELANATGSLINSIATKLDTSSFQTYTGSVDTKFTTLSNLTSSLNASTASQQNSIDLIGQFTSSENTKNTTLATYTGSIDTKFTTLGTYTGSIDTKFTTLANITTSLNTSTASQQNSIDLLGAFSASENTKNTTLATYTGSVDIKFTTLATYTGSVDSKFSTLQTTTASIQNSVTIINTFTASVDTKFTTLTNVTSSLISKTGSYATTGSNTFYGTQTMSGSVYVTGDLVVIGSSSISNISASSLSIGDNQIVLNTFTPAIRYGGISVIDSGSNGTTGSLWWDSVNNHWLYEHPGDSPATYNSAILIAGPTNTGSLGQEVGLISNRLTVASGTDHISSSQIYVDNTTVAIPANLQVTGSFDLRNAEFNATASNSSAGNVLVSTNPTASYNSAFYNYSITSGTNARAGQIMSIWNGNTLKYTEVTTTDIGNTSTAVFSASLSGGNILLHLSSSGVWNVRSIVNLL